ncbi:hypothetical protein PP613_23625 [Mycobacteroides abscessus]|nr:hypothetical protein [Mycobacteroides abscessus]MDM2412334.1 hypothetical protein [Mycobacteroides abscessus]
MRSGLIKLTREYEDIIMKVRAANNMVYKYIEYLDAMRRARR